MRLFFVNKEFSLSNRLIRLSLRKLLNFGIFGVFTRIYTHSGSVGPSQPDSRCTYTNCTLIVHGLDTKPTRLIDLRDSADLTNLYCLKRSVSKRLTDILNALFHRLNLIGNVVLARTRDAILISRKNLNRVFKIT